MSKKICGIYKIQNKINRKLYIGSSIDIKGRWREHKRVLKNNIHHSEHLQRAWNKYGKDNFIFAILEECEENILLEREQYYLDLYKSYERNKGYNISKSSSSPMAGRKHTEETKKMLKEEIASRDSSCWVRGEDKFNAIFTNEDIINIKKLIYDGTNIKDIAEIYNCGANTITQIKTGERWSHIKTEYDDLITQTPRQKLSEKDVIEIKRLLIEQELTIKEIAELFNITLGMVSIIKRLQSWKNVGEEYNEELIRRNIVNKLNKNKVIEIRKLLNDGKDYREIAELFGVDKTSISYIRDNKTWKEVS